MRKFFSLIAAVLFAGSMMAESVTLTMSDFAATSFTDQTSGISVATAKNSGGSEPAYNSKGADLRVYAKGSITISASKNITAISFTISTQGKKRLAPLTASVGEVAVAGTPGFTAEWTGSATSVTLTVGDKADYGTDGNTKAGQLDFTAMVVTLEEGGEPVVGPTVLQAVSDSTTWDFSKITANTENALYVKEGIQLTDESEPSKNDEVIYADYSEDLMTIDEEFNKAAIAFKGEYPIRKNQYCQAGTLHFKADVAGTIVVKFSDTGTSASATAVKRYLVVNGVQTEYWTSRENNGETPYDAQLNVVSEKIEVPAGDVTITGSSAIVMYYVTFVPEEQEEPELPVYTCAQVQANEATAEGVLNEVTVMFVNGSNVFVKDETGMTQVYLKSNGLTIGDKVSGIKGASTLFKSTTPEFVPTNAPADWTVVAGETPVYDEKETIATTADVNGVYVFKNVTFAEATEFTTEAQVNATVTIGEESIVLRNNYKFAYSFAADKAYDVKAVVVIYNNAAQLYFISAEEHISTAIDNTAVDAKAVKIVRDGQLLILKGNKTFNAQGAIVR